MEYLSPAWLAAADELVAADAGLAAAARTRRLVVEYVVEGGPHGDVIYHLRLAEGVARLTVGPSDSPDIRLRCDRGTALAVATGALGAQRAFMEGRLRVCGDIRVIVDAQPVVAGLGDILAPIRPAPAPPT